MGGPTPASAASCSKTEVVFLTVHNIFRRLSMAPTPESHGDQTHALKPKKSNALQNIPLETISRIPPMEKAERKKTSAQRALSNRALYVLPSKNLSAEVTELHHKCHPLGLGWILVPLPKRLSSSATSTGASEGFRKGRLGWWGWWLWTIEYARNKDLKSTSIS